MPNWGGWGDRWLNRNVDAVESICVVRMINSGFKTEVVFFRIVWKRNEIKKQDFLPTVRRRTAFWAELLPLTLWEVVIMGMGRGNGTAVCVWGWSDNRWHLSISPGSSQFLCCSSFSPHSVRIQKSEHNSCVVSANKNMGGGGNSSLFKSNLVPQRSRRSRCGVSIKPFAQQNSV